MYCLLLVTKLTIFSYTDTLSKVIFGKNYLPLENHMKTLILEGTFFKKLVY